MPIVQVMNLQYFPWHRLVSLENSARKKRSEFVWLLQRRENGSSGWKICRLNNLQPEVEWLGIFFVTFEKYSALPLFRYNFFIRYVFFFGSCSVDLWIPNCNRFRINGYQWGSKECLLNVIFLRLPAISTVKCFLPFGKQFSQPYWLFRALELLHKSRIEKHVYGIIHIRIRFFCPM